MATIAERIVQIAKERCGNNMSEFARQLGVTPAYISKFNKNSDAQPSDYLKERICTRFNIRREWLERGEEPMLSEMSEAKEIEQFFKQILIDDCTEDGMEFRRALIVALAKIPRDKWGSIAEAFRELADAVNGTKKEQ